MSVAVDEDLERLRHLSSLPASTRALHRQLSV